MKQSDEYFRILPNRPTWGKSRIKSMLEANCFDFCLISRWLCDLSKRKTSCMSCYYNQLNNEYFIWSVESSFRFFFSFCNCRECIRNASNTECKFVDAILTSDRCFSRVLWVYRIRRKLAQGSKKIGKKVREKEKSQMDDTINGWNCK